MNHRHREGAVPPPGLLHEQDHPQIGAAGLGQIEFTVTANVSGPYGTEVLVGPPGSQAVSNPFYVCIAQ
jgi:hypothetical protein